MALDVQPDSSALWFSAAIALATGIVAGLLPALRAGASDPLDLLRRTPIASPFGSRTLHGFVVVQMALSVILVLGLGLLWDGYLRRADVRPVFKTDDVVAAALDLAPLNYEAQKVANFYGRVPSEVQALPQVRAAGLATATPFASAESLSLQTPSGASSVSVHRVSSGYFQTSGFR